MIDVSVKTYNTLGRAIRDEMRQQKWDAINLHREASELLIRTELPPKDMSDVGVSEWARDVVKAAI